MFRLSNKENYNTSIENEVINITKIKKRALKKKNNRKKISQRNKKAHIKSYFNKHQISKKLVYDNRIEEEIVQNKTNDLVQ